jgi:hypothetical protein
MFKILILPAFVIQDFDIYPYLDTTKKNTEKLIILEINRPFLV